MSVRGFAPGKEVTEPRGMWSVLGEKGKGYPNRASFMQNARISPGVVASRPGTSIIAPVTGMVTGLFNWIRPGTETLIAQFSGMVYVQNALLELNVDIPRLELFVFPAAPTTFAGWAIAGAVNTISTVALSVDGVLLGNATYGASRPDVAAAHPGQAGSPNLGWTYSIDLSTYDTGGHVLDVVATDSAANTVSIQVPFFVSRPPESEQNLVLYQDGNNIRSYRQSDQSVTTLLTPATSLRPSFSDLDIWAYIAGYDSAGNGQFQTRIFDGTNVDTAFRPTVFPPTPTMVDGGAGYCTQGTHLFGFVYQNRNGFTGPPAALNSSQGQISFTLTADQRAINVSVDFPAVPDGGGNSQLFLLMSRSDSPADWYFVPTDQISGSIGALPVPFNAAATLHFVANISDEDLAASADSANDYFNYLAQDADGAGPFSPSFVVAYGQRMCYGVGTALYVSEINAPQQLTIDQHMLTTPNKRRIGYAFPLPGSTDLYVTGDKWTSRFTDSGGVPATWAQPIKISEALGAPFPSCVCFRTRGEYAWMVTEAGIYVFNGSFADRPVTYLVEDIWKRVNWAAAYAIETADDTVGRKFYAAVPLDGATKPTHLFCIDYTSGLDFNDVDIGLDVFNRPTLGSIAVVREIAEEDLVLWIGPSGDSGGYSFQVTVTDALGATASVTCTIPVNP
jgi:hypothetical protein